MIQLKNVIFNYQSMQMQFDLNIPAQQKVAIVGASGAGKSTLLNLIAGFDYANKGEIWLNGINHTHTEPYQRPVSMLFQENNLFPHLSVAQNIALGIQPNLALTSAQQHAVEQAAQAVGLQDLLDRKPTRLSGGQKQRVALARCFLRNQPILLLDEPFSALDPQLRQEMMSLLDELCAAKHLTMLLVTHQPNELSGKIDRIIHIEQGKIMNSTTETQL